MNYIKAYSPTAMWSYDTESSEFVLKDDTGKKLHSVSVDPEVVFRNGKVPFRGFFFDRKKGIIPMDEDASVDDACLCFFYIRGRANFHGNMDTKIVSIVSVPHADAEFHKVKKLGDSFTIVGCDVGVVVSLRKYGSFFIFETGFGAMSYCFNNGTLHINGAVSVEPE